jgi:lipooligosaccharide transport system ATP-binding protein
VSGEANGIALDNVVLRVENLRKSYGENEVVRGPQFLDPPRRMFRSPRPERCRQDDDAALLPRADRSGQRDHRARRPAVPQAARAARVRVGVVPQLDNLDPDFTVTENLVVYGRYFGIPNATLAPRIPSCSNLQASRPRATSAFERCRAG